MAGVYFNDKYIGDIGGGTSSGGSRPKVTTAWLRQVSWQNNKQTVDVSGVTADNTVIVCPDVGYYRPYYDNSVNPAGQAAESMSFECVDVPDQDIRVNFLLYDDTEELAEAAPYLLTQGEDGTLSVTLDGTAVTEYTLQKLSNGSWADTTAGELADGDTVRAVVDGRMSNYVSYIDYNKVAADKVIALINAAESSGTESDVTAARSAYDALTDTQKGMVTNYSNLQFAESKLFATKAVNNLVLSWATKPYGNGYDLTANVENVDGWEISYDWKNINDGDRVTAQKIHIPRSDASAWECTASLTKNGVTVSHTVSGKDAIDNGVEAINISELDLKANRSAQSGSGTLYLSGMLDEYADSATYQWQYSNNGSAWKNCGETGANTQSFSVNNLALSFRIIVTPKANSKMLGDAITLNAQ